MIIDSSKESNINILQIKSQAKAHLLVITKRNGLKFKHFPHGKIVCKVKSIKDLENFKAQGNEQNTTRKQYVPETRVTQL